MDGNGYAAAGGGRDDRRSRDDRDRRRSDTGRDRGSSGRDRDRERDRGGRSDRDKERRGRSRSRSRSRSHSRSPSPRKPRQRLRKSLFDVLPAGGIPAVPAVAPAAAVMPEVAAAPVIAPTMAPLAFPAAPNMFPNAPTAAMFGAAAGFGMAGLPGAFPGMGLAPPPSQQATRHARRVYVGGLPPTANEQSVATFFSHALAAVGGNTAGPGNSVVNVYINREKNFAFVEFRTVEECSNAMALDSIMFEGVSVRVRRPNDYNPAAAASLGPSVPAASLNLAAIGLGGGGGGGGGGGNAADTHERVFVGGLPYYLTEEQCRELLGSFGPIKSFDLVKDRETGNSKGYGFVVYADPAVTDIACAGLNGLKMGERVLTVRRATEGAPPKDGGVPAPMVDMSALGGMGGVTTLSGATRIVMLTEAVTPEELADDEEYNDIMQDMREECGKYGTVSNILIPRPAADNPTPPGLGKVIIEFVDINAAVKARNAMHGRRFGGRTVVATYLQEDNYYRGQYD